MSRLRNPLSTDDHSVPFTVHTSRQWRAGGAAGHNVTVEVDLSHLQRRWYAAAAHRSFTGDSDAITAIGAHCRPTSVYFTRRPLSPSTVTFSVHSG